MRSFQVLGLAGFLIAFLSGCSPDEKDKASVELEKTEKISPEEAERWSAMVKKQLAVLEDSILEDDEEVSAIISKSVLFSSKAEVADSQSGLNESLQISRFGGEGELVAIDAGDFKKRVREQFSSPITDLHFKLIGLRKSGEKFITEQRFSASGFRESKRTNSYGIAEIQWTIPSEGKTSQLLGFAMKELVRVEQNSGTGFEDVAGSVLSGNDSWHEQLQLGMNTWGRRIDHSLTPDFLGYHGMAVRDVNGDELEDLYLCQPGGLPNLLFLQEKNGTMSDVSASAGVDFLDNSTGALLVDLDNDGDSDLAIATQGAFLILENDGTGKFALQKSFPELGRGFSPTAADYDLDGDLDLLVLRYGGNSSEAGDFPTPHPFRDARNGGANVMLQNEGDFQFQDATTKCGLGFENHRFSFAASWEDFDNDGLLDVYIANDFGPNQLFRNTGGRFEDVSAASNAQDFGFGMSATWADYNRDGAMDLYVSNMFSGAGSQLVPQADLAENQTETFLKMVRGNSLLRNGASGKFSDVTDPMSEGFGRWAWGAKFADLNNDGWEDLYLANGYITQEDEEDL